MSITWTVLHPVRLVVAIGKGDLSSTDILFCADGFAKAGINPYRKIFDLTRIVNAPSPADIRLVGTSMAARAAGQPFGPIAIVAASSVIAELARIFEETSAANRPVRIFRDLYAAREWLDKVAPVADPDVTPR